MELFTKEHLKELIEKQADLSISVFVPTYRANRNDENYIGFKNAVKEVKSNLTERGLEEEEIKDLMEPLVQMLDDEEFWKFQSDGLAVFRTKDTFEYFTVPLHFENFTYIGAEFYLKPMVDLLSHDEEFYLMAISLNKIRLFDCTRYSLEEIDISGMFPENVEASKWFKDENPTQQSHSLPTNELHGHGANKDSRTDDIRRFFRDVKTGMRDFFRGKRKKLMLAGVDHVVELCRETLDYPYTYETHIYGNHDDTNPLLLHEQAVSIIEQQFNVKLQEEVDSTVEMLDTDMAGKDLKQIVKASVSGKIDKLFVKNREVAWGYFDEEQFKVEPTASKDNGEICLLNKAAVETILNGGTVHLIDRDNVPAKLGSSKVFASYRH